MRSLGDAGRERRHRTRMKGGNGYMKRGWLTGLAGRTLPAMGMLCALALGAPVFHEQAQAQVALPGSGNDAPAAAVRILSDQDVKTYKAIFDAQARADWATADKLVKRLQDRVLLGHVLYERYMHPTAYRTSYNEAAAWMQAYADHPGADRIYRLGQLRRVKGGPKLVAPVPIDPPPPPQKPVHYTKEELARIRDLRQTQTTIRQLLRRSETPQAEKRFWAAEQRGLFDRETFGRTLASIAASYYFDGDNAKAMALGTLSGATEGRGRYLGNWFAGLAAWRSDDCKRAAGHFEKAAEAAGDANPWDMAGAAFWAARARLACREPEKVNALLDAAARHNRTFYGLVAMRQLGRDIVFSWDYPPLSEQDLKKVTREPGVRRAIALAQVGRAEWADLEMRYVWRRAKSEEIHPPLLGLASRLNLPSTQVRGAKVLERKQIVLPESTLYPVPDWQPAGGFKLDRALIFAFMRQESEFFTRAESHAGARGLMQLMPATASYISRDRTLQRNKERLYDPAYNMALGQQYIEYLMSKEEMGGNLFFIASAYNGGPGNLSRWLQRIDFRNDPLLFIESIPLDETRDYVEKVIANMWIYRMRMGQSVASLDAVAAGEWPVYIPQDKH